MQLRTLRPLEGAQPEPTPASAGQTSLATLRALTGDTTTTLPSAEAGPHPLPALLGIDPMGSRQNLIGAAKSVGQTVMAVPKAISSATGIKEPDLFERVRARLQPTPAQETGAFVGRMAQYAVPVALTGGASLPAQVAAGGIGAGLVASGSGDDPRSAAAIGAAGPVAGSLLKRVAPMLRRGAQERVASAIDPRGQEDKKALAKVLPEITARKPFAWSSEGLRDQFEQNAEAVALQLDDVISKSGITAMNMNRVAHSMDSMVNAIKGNASSVTPEAQAAMRQLRQVQAEIKEIGRRSAPHMRLGAGGTLPQPIIPKTTVGASLERVRELKQQYGQIVEGVQKQFFRDQAAAGRGAAAKEGYHAIRTAMVKAVPKAGELGKEYQRQATVRDLLAKGEIRNIAGTTSGIGRVAEAGAVAGGIVTGNPRLVGTGAAIMGLLKFTSSTPYKLATANLRTTFANAIEAGNLTLASQLMAQMVRESMMRREQ